MDVLHDNSFRTFYQLAEQHGKLIPAYVLESIQDKEASADYPDREFADDVSRTFPLDSPASVWLSAVYFDKAAESYKPVLRAHIRDRIDKAAEVFGIGKDVAAIREAVSKPLEKRASSDSDYGWLEKNAAGVVVRRSYPMFDASGVKRAGDHFAENRSKYPFEMRHPLAKAILQKAAEYGVEVPDCVRREAGQGMPRRDTVMAELLARAEMCKDAEVSIALANISELVATVDMADLQPELIKIAETIETADKITGADRQYGRKVQAPCDFLFDISAKSAEEALEDTVELDRYMFSAAKLAELDPEVFSNVLGDDFVGRVSVDGKIASAKLCDELTSLPRPDRIALEQHLERTLARK